jgi:hypothetical protein
MKILKFEGNNSCQKCHLLGDKTKQTEPECVVITFPGGHFELSRHSDDSYWAHIAITKEGEINGDGDFRPVGKFIEGRIDYIYESGKNIEPFPVKCEHIAVRIGKNDPNFPRP